ncbi:hypothetical protein MK338_00505, partial [Streptococcus vestibularis]|nr:hypothetical protein [Streptococcus vestibularis]
YEEGRVD